MLLEMIVDFLIYYLIFYGISGWVIGYLFYLLYYFFIFRYVIECGYVWVDVIFLFSYLCYIWYCSVNGEIYELVWCGNLEKNLLYCYGI